MKKKDKNLKKFFSTKKFKIFVIVFAVILISFPFWPNWVSEDTVNSCQRMKNGSILMSAAAPMPDQITTTLVPNYLVGEYMNKAEEQNRCVHSVGFLSYLRNFMREK